MSKEQGDQVKEEEKRLITEMKTNIFVDEPYGPEAIEFYKVVFGAIELERVYEKIETDDKIKGSFRVISSELQLGSTCIMVSEHTHNSPWLKKRKFGTRNPIMYVYMEDVEAVVDLALKLGAVNECQDCNYADIRDPYGILWCIRPACMMSDIVVEGSSKDSPEPPQDIPKETNAYREDIYEETKAEEIGKKTRFF